MLSRLHVREESAGPSVQANQLSCPIMRGGAGLSAHGTRWATRQEHQYLAAAKLSAQHDVTFGTYAVKLKGILGNNPDRS